MVFQVLFVFSKSIQCQYREGKNKNLLEQSVSFILKYKTFENISSFPSKVSLNNIDYDNKEDISRIAWCYGDLGIAIALYHANQILNNEEVEREYIELLHKSLKGKINLYLW